MILLPYNPKAGYDMTLFYSSKSSREEAKKRLEELNTQGPKGWKLIELEG